MIALIPGHNLLCFCLYQTDILIEFFIIMIYCVKGAVSVFFRCHRYLLHLNHENRPIIYVHRLSISPYNSADCKLFAGKDT